MSSSINYKKICLDCLKQIFEYYGTYILDKKHYPFYKLNGELMVWPYLKITCAGLCSILNRRFYRVVYCPVVSNYTIDQLLNIARQINTEILIIATVGQFKYLTTMIIEGRWKCTTLNLESLLISVKGISDDCNIKEIFIHTYTGKTCSANLRRLCIWDCKNKLTIQNNIQYLAIANISKSIILPKNSHMKEVILDKCDSLENVEIDIVRINSFTGKSIEKSKIKKLIITKSEHILTIPNTSYLEELILDKGVQIEDVDLSVLQKLKVFSWGGMRIKDNKLTVYTKSVINKLQL